MSAKKRNNTNGGGSPALQRVRECGSGKPGHARPENAPAAGESRQPGAIPEHECLPRRVGRPHAFPPVPFGLAKAYTPGVRTDRGMQNRLYAKAAIDAMQGAEGGWKSFPWIRPGTRRGRWCVLAELGRLGDAKRIIAFARTLESKPPSTALEAMQIIRQFRRAKHLTQGSFELCRAYLRLTTQFRRENPTMAPWDVGAAVRMFWQSLPRKVRLHTTVGTVTLD